MEDISAEHVRVDNNSSPHQSENSALIQTDHPPPTPKGELDATARPSLPPPTTNLQPDDESRFLNSAPPRSKPLFRGFERPSFSRIAILTFLCLVTYPAFYTLTLVAKDKSLFAVRVIVSVWCSGVGFALGYILLEIAAQHLKAASEFALVGTKTF